MRDDHGLLSCVSNWKLLFVFHFMCLVQRQTKVVQWHNIVATTGYLFKHCNVILWMNVCISLCFIHQVSMGSPGHGTSSFSSTTGEVFPLKQACRSPLHLQNRMKVLFHFALQVPKGRLITVTYRLYKVLFYWTEF